MKALHTIAFILLVIGGISFLLTGIFSWGLASFLSGALARIVYILIGLSAVWLIIDHKKTCRQCESKSGMSGSNAPQM